MSETAKRNAARAALKNEIRDGQVLGVGTGSTVAIFIEELGLKVRQERLEILCVPSSLQTQSLCIRAGLDLTTLEEHPSLSVAVDGADEIDPKVNLIKGGGAALTREKIIATAARRFAVIADESKLVRDLGSHHPVPLEVIPFALGFVENQLKHLKPKRVRVRMSGSGKDGPVITDNGNLILDAEFPRIVNPREVSAGLKLIPGVVESGLFPDMADIAYLGRTRGVRLLK